MSLFPTNHGPAQRLRALLDDEGILQLPGSYDALSARMIELAGFKATFLGGFSVAATRLGLPDVGLLSYGEMIEQSRNVCAATSLPVIGDADTGYGNAVNAQRTLIGCAQAGLACMMIEDQQWPKRCGHTAGKDVVDRAEAIRRVHACVTARQELGLDILIMARTDAAAVEGFDEAMFRVEAFADAGADITFLEAPETIDQMKRYCAGTPGRKTVNLVEDGRTPWLEPNELHDLGYDVILYPVTLLLQGLHAMGAALSRLTTGRDDAAERVHFDDARRILGWSTYEARLQELEGTDG